MQQRHVSSLSVLMTFALIAAAGCGDDTNASCDDGDCAGSSGNASAGGSANGGSSSSKGGATSAGKPGNGGAAVGGTSSNAGATTAGATTAGATSAGAAGAATLAGTAGFFGLAGASTGGTGNVAGSAGTAGNAPLATGGTTAGGSDNGGNAGSTAVAGAGATAPVAAVAILKYDFDDDNGTGTKVTDASGNGHHGELAGATWTAEVEGRNARGASFADADAAVALPDDFLTSAAGLTVSAWVKLSANEVGNRLFDFGSGPENHIYFTFNNGTGMELGVQTSAGLTGTAFTSVTLPTGVWKHVAVTLGAAGARIYIDGWEVARNTSLVVVPSTLGATPNNWIGKSQIPEPAFAGTMDEFYVYDNPITPAEIRARAWPKLDYSIWHFDESEGEDAFDSSDLKRDARMVRATFGAGVLGNAAQLYNPSDQDEPPAGADQYVQLPEGVVKDCTAGYTVAAWLNVIAVRTHARLFEFSNDTATAVFGRTMGGWTQHWALGDFTDATVVNPYASIDYTWPVGTWHHVAAVRDGQVLHAYLDGAESGTKTPFTLPSTVPAVSSLGSTLYNYIGRTRDSAAPNERRRLHGFVDEFLLSCRPYTKDEIKLLAVRP